MKIRDAEPCKFGTVPAPATTPENYSGSEQNVPALPAPDKMYRLRRFRLRGCKVVQIWDGCGSI